MTSPFPRTAPAVGLTVAGAGVAGLAALSARRQRSRGLSREISGRKPGCTTDDGVLLHVETDGPSDARVAVVFAHGLSVDLGEHAAQRASLGDRFRIVVFDQRGHGRSGWGNYRAATVARLGRDLGEVLDAATDAGPVVLVGHSLGGMAVMALAEQRPQLFGEKVIAAALISTSAGRLRLGLPSPVARVVLGGAIGRALLWLLWMLAPLTERIEPFLTQAARRSLRRRLFGRTSPPPAILDEIQRMWVDMRRPIAAAFYAGAILHDTSPGLDVLANVPVLVLTGDADGTIGPEHSRRIAAAVGASARLVVVPEAGHMVNMTHPAIVNAALERLIDEANATLTARRRLQVAVKGSAAL